MAKNDDKNVTIYFKDKEILEQGREKARKEERTFSSYVALLIRRDLAKTE